MKSFYYFTAGFNVSTIGIALRLEELWAAGVALVLVVILLGVAAVCDE